jgi:hypothetical protein
MVRAAAEMEPWLSTAFNKSIKGLRTKAGLVLRLRE